MNCAHCQKEFMPGHWRQKYCGEVECNRQRHNLARQRSYWADPEASRAYGSRWVHEHKEQDKAIKRKSYTVICTNCGVSRYRSDLPRAARVGYLCRECETQARMVEVPCWGCEQPVRRKSMQGTKYVACPGCRGLLINVGRQIGVTREAVRQAVAKKLAAGLAQTRKQAAEMILKERLGEQP